MTITLITGGYFLLFSEMLDEVQDSGQEEQFFKRLRTELKPITMEVPKWEYFIPVLGKTMKAVEVLIDSNNIDEFKKTKDYKYIRDFDLDGDFFSDEFDLLPVTGYKKMISNVVSVGLVIYEWLALRIFGPKP